MSDDEYSEIDADYNADDYDEGSDADEVDDDEDDEVDDDEVDDEGLNDLDEVDLDEVDGESVTDSTATSTLGALDIRHKQKTKYIDKKIIVHPSEHQLSDVISKFEYTDLIGTRATQIANESRIYVDPGNLIDSIDIAKKELYERRCPLFIKRELDHERIELWDPNTMIVPYRLLRDMAHNN
jgi:DNA-directed RNA polymerase subunit K/omega